MKFGLLVFAFASMIAPVNSIVVSFSSSVQGLTEHIIPQDIESKTLASGVSEKMGVKNKVSASVLPELEDNVVFSPDFIEEGKDKVSASVLPELEDNVVFSPDFIEEGKNKVSASVVPELEDNVVFSADFIEEGKDKVSASVVPELEDNVVFSPDFIEEGKNKVSASVLPELEDNVVFSPDFIEEGKDKVSASVVPELKDNSVFSADLIQEGNKNGTFSAAGVLSEKLEQPFPADVPNVILRHNNCSNISKADMSAVAQVYPHVIINCELEKSTLIPKELYGPDNFNKTEGSDTEPIFSMFGKEKMAFYEILSVTEKSPSIWKQPISACVRPRSTGKGSFETSVNLNSLLRFNGGVSKGFKFFVSGLSSSGTSMFVGEWSYSVACNYENAAVRPVAEIFTVIIKERGREWNVDLGASDFLKFGEWVELDSVKIYPNSIVLSCISETQVPDICSWSDVELQRELEKNLFDDIE